MSLMRKILDKLALSIEDVLDEYINTKFVSNLDKNIVDFNLDKDVANANIQYVIQSIKDINKDLKLQKITVNVTTLESFINSNINLPVSDAYLITAISTLIIFANIDINNITNPSSFDLMTTLFYNINYLLSLLPSSDVAIDKNAITLAIISITASNYLLNINQFIATLIKTKTSFNQLVDNTTVLVSDANNNFSIMSSAYALANEVSNLAVNSKNAIINVNNISIPNVVSKVASDINDAYNSAYNFIESNKGKYLANNNNLAASDITNYNDTNKKIAAVITPTTATTLTPTVWSSNSYASAGYSIAVAFNTVYSSSSSSYSTYNPSISDTNMTSVASVKKINDTASAAVSKYVTSLLNAATPKLDSTVVSNVATNAAKAASYTSIDSINTVASSVSQAVINSLNSANTKPDTITILTVAATASAVFCASTYSVLRNPLSSSAASCIYASVIQTLNSVTPKLDNTTIVSAASTVAAAYSIYYAKTVTNSSNNFVNGMSTSSNITSFTLNLFIDNFLAIANAKNFIDFMVDTYKSKLITNDNIKNLFNDASNMIYNSNSYYNTIKKVMYLSKTYEVDVNNNVTNTDYFNLRKRSQIAFAVELVNATNNISSYLSSNGVLNVNFINSSVSSYLNNAISTFNSSRANLISPTNYLQQLLVVVFIYLSNSPNKFVLNI
jgi:hypothetical protein